MEEIKIASLAPEGAEVSSTLKALKGSIKHALEAGYDILDQELDKADEDKVIDIVASLKGSMNVIADLCEKYSPLDKEVKDKISKKEDEFVKGLGIHEEEPKEAKEEIEEK